MPKSSVGGFGRGFLRLERSGPRLVIIVVPSVNVEPFDTEVIVVVTEPTLPAYGLPDDTVIAIPLSKSNFLVLNLNLNANFLTLIFAFPITRVVVSDCT